MCDGFKERFQLPIMTILIICCGSSSVVSYNTQNFKGHYESINKASEWNFVFPPWKWYIYTVLGS